MKKKAMLILGILFIVFGVLVPLMTTLVSFLLPETFASSTKILNPAVNPTEMAAAVALTQSPAIIEKVVSELKLGVEWGRKYRQPGELPVARCAAILKSSMKIEVPRNTAVLGITIFSDNKDEAVVIANKVAAVYCAATPGAMLLEQAQANPKAVRPNKRLNILLGLVFGAGFAGLGIFLIILSRKEKPTATAAH